MSAVDRYLVDLDDELHVRLWRRERIVAEARAHLEQRAEEAQQQEHVGRAEAEQRAVAAFGSAEQVAAGFAAEAGGALNTAAVAVSDLSYRVARKPTTLLAIAWWPLGLVALGIVGVTSGLAWMWVCSMGGFLFGLGFVELRPAPRKGYLRRWRKVDRAARRQIISLLAGGKTPSDARAGRVALEVCQRARYLRRYVLWISVPFIFVLVGLTIVSKMVIGEPHLVDGLAIVLAGVAAAALAAGIIVASWDSRRARRQVASELAALEVIEEVAGEALEDGAARLHEHIDGKRFSVELVPENPSACNISLEVRPSAIWLWLGHHDFPLQVKRRHADHLAQLGLYLDAAVSGRVQMAASPVERQRGRALGRRLYTQFSATFQTKAGPRHVTGRRFLAQEWEEEWRRGTSQLGLAPADLVIEYGFAPYQGGETR